MAAHRIARRFFYFKFFTHERGHLVRVQLADVFERQIVALQVSAEGAYECARLRLVDTRVIPVVADPVYVGRYLVYVVLEDAHQRAAHLICLILVLLIQLEEFAAALKQIGQTYATK